MRVRCIAKVANRWMAFATVALLVLASSTAFAAGHGGKGKKGKGDDGDNEHSIAWQDSYDAALDFASHGPRPLMVVLTRDSNDEDMKYLQQLGEWPAIDELSKKYVAMLWQTNSAPRGAELAAQFNVKTFPFVVWLDQYGNALYGQTFPDSASAIQSVATNWKSTLDSVTKYIQGRLARGDKLLGKGKLREAYQEYSTIAPFKGPDPEKARAGKQKAIECWKKLAQLAATTTIVADRTMLIKGLTKETEGLDCFKIVADEVAAVSQSKLTPAKPPPAEPEQILTSGPGAGKPAVTAAPPQPQAAPTPPPAAPAPAEIKPLKQLASAPVRTEKESDESNFDLHSLSESSDERLKNAGKLVQEGLTAYRQACSDAMDRGEARNALLQKAHDAFDQAMKAIDEVNTAKPSAQLDGVMTQISMLMYGCLKYQSL